MGQCDERDIIDVNYFMLNAAQHARSNQRFWYNISSENRH